MSHFEVFPLELSKARNMKTSIFHCSAVGVEKEEYLKRQLRCRGVPFETEVELRLQGFDKTPDVKLKCPCLIDDRFVVNWMESKASFGDPRTHDSYLHDQYRTYTNRFGPGLVIYWSGFVAEIQHSDGIHIYERIPLSIRTLDNVYANLSYLP